MSVVISLGGSFMFDRPAEVKKIRTILSGLNERAVVITGGGKIARDYIALGKIFGLKESDLHQIGIYSTRINAYIISRILGGNFSEENPQKLEPKSKITLMGGYKPGWTTDTCTAYAAVSTKAKVIFNLSKEKGVYTKDPKLPGAEFIKTLEFRDLYSFTKGERKPGMNFIFDPQAAKICQKHGIEVVVTKDVADIGRYIRGVDISGTLIKN